MLYSGSRRIKEEVGGGVELAGHLALAQFQVLMYGDGDYRLPRRRGFEYIILP